MVRFYVGEISGTTPQTVKIYTDSTNHLDVSVSEGNKWYSYVLPKDKGLYRIEGDSVKKVVVKADISFEGNNSSYPYPIIIPTSTIEASFKGSNTSKVTDMNGMFSGCSGLTSLDVSKFNTTNVTTMSNMFNNCSNLTSLTLSGWVISDTTNTSFMFKGCSKLNTIRTVDCSEPTRTKIQNQLTKDGITGVIIVTK